MSLAGDVEAQLLYLADLSADQISGMDDLVAQGIPFGNYPREGLQHHLQSAISLSMDRHLVADLIKFLDLPVNPLLIIIEDSLSDARRMGIGFAHGGSSAAHAPVQENLDSSNLHPFRTESPANPRSHEGIGPMIEMKA